MPTGQSEVSKKTMVNPEELESEMERKRHKIFDTLKPICLSLLGDCNPASRENSRLVASKLHDLLARLEEISDVEATFDSALIEMLVFPLLSLFRSMNNGAPIPENVVEAWLQCILFLLKNTLWRHTCDPVMQRQLITLFTLSVDSPARRGVQTAEEIQHLAVQCLEAMMPVRYMEGRYQQQANTIQDDAFRPMLAQCITVLLNIARDERKMKLRLDAIRTLSVILLDNLQTADTLDGLFPGVASALCRIVWQRKEKEHHQIIVASLDLLGDLIVVAMNDSRNITENQRPLTFQDLRHVAIMEKHDEESTIERTATAPATHKSRLYSLLKEILSVKSHPEWRARIAFAEISHKLLSHCSHSLDNCVSLFVEVLVLHADDDYPDVAANCRKRMHELLSVSSFQDTIMPVLKDGLYSWMQELPRYLISGDEQEKMNVMALIIGYILLLRDHSQSVLDEALGRVSDGWLAALEIDKDNLSVLEEKHGKHIELHVDGAIYPKVHFKHLITDRTISQAARMFNVIGRFGNLRHWVTYFMNCIHVDEGIAEEAQPQAAYVIHGLLAGASAMNEDVGSEWIVTEEQDNTRVKKVALQALHDVMDILNSSPAQNNAPTSIVSRTQISVDFESSQVLTMCFGLQIVGLAAVILGSVSMQEELITLLYPILSHLGSPNLYIRSYALITLDTIALVCGQRDAQYLAIQNVDYIINMVSQRISMLTSNPRVPLVLKALIHVGGPSTIGFLQDSVEEIYDALDRYHMDEWLCQQLCAVLTEIVQTIEASTADEREKAVEEIRPRIQSKQESATASKEMVEFVEDLRRKKDDDTALLGTPTMDAIGRYFLEEQAKNKPTPHLAELLENDLDKEELSGPKDDDDAAVEEKKTPLSKDQQMTFGIMSKVIHFLSAPSPQLRSQMLVLLASGANVLVSRPRELFPLVHQLWTSIIQRLDDPEHFVKFHASSLVQTLSRTCGDFLSTRVVQDVWPRFKKLLSQREQTPSYSAFSYVHRLDRCILQTLTDVAARVPLRLPMALEILDHTQQFLDINVHLELQQHAVLLFEALGRQHPDTVWLCCLSLRRDPRENPHNQYELSPFVVPHWMTLKSNGNCNENAERIMLSCCI